MFYSRSYQLTSPHLCFLTVSRLSVEIKKVHLLSSLAALFRESALILLFGDDTFSPGFLFSFVPSHAPHLTPSYPLDHLARALCLSLSKHSGRVNKSPVPTKHIGGPGRKNKDVVMGTTFLFLFP